MQSPAHLLDHPLPQSTSLYEASAATFSSSPSFDVRVFHKPWARCRRPANRQRCCVSCVFVRSQHADGSCGTALAESAGRMPEDWGQEMALAEQCAAEVKAHCVGVKPGRAQLYQCLECAPARSSCGGLHVGDLLQKCLASDLRTLGLGGHCESHRTHRFALSVVP